MSLLRTGIFLIVGLVGSFSTAVAQVPLRTQALSQFPYQAFVVNDDVAIHSGPDKGHYATSKLNRGDGIVVHRHRPDGWCGIGPPEGSFSLVPATGIDLADSETAIVVADGVKAWVGTNLGQTDRPLSQMTLNVGDRVEILGTVSWPSPGNQSSTWYQISPPAGELRWVHINDLQLPGHRTEIPQLEPNNGQAKTVGFNQQLNPMADSDDQVSSVESKDAGGHEGRTIPSWFDDTRVGYDGGFLIANQQQLDLQAGDFPFRMRINGWGQLRETTFSSDGATPDRNQFQLARARLIFSGNSFTEDFAYFFQFDGRSSSGDNFRLLDYVLTYDVGHHKWGLDKGTIGFKTGKYKMPFDLARYLSAREIEFSDRSMASTFFDVNRSLAWGLYGRSDRRRIPLHWETAIFNGLVTGGAETGSSGDLDDNFAYSARVYCYPTGDWGVGELADFEGHCCLATRMGAGFASSTIDRTGSTEFEAVRVVDSGQTLSSILPATVSQYTVDLYSVDASMKYYGWSATLEYYFRQISDIQGAAVPNLFDHGHWLQIGKFVVPDKLELLARWSRVDGNSGTLGRAYQSSEEIAGGFAWYIRDQHAKFTADATYLDGAPINSAALDIFPGDAGWLFRTQIQFAF